MKQSTEEKIKKEVKQVGIDVLIAMIILSLMLGFIAGVIVY